MGRTPLGSDTASQSEWHEDECEDGDKEDDADDIELPEESDDKTTSTQHLERSAVVFEGAGSLGASLGNPEHGKKRDRADWEMG